MPHNVTIEKIPPIRAKPCPVETIGHDGAPEIQARILRVYNPDGVFIMAKADEPASEWICIHVPKACESLLGESAEVIHDWLSNTGRKWEWAKP